MRDRTWISKEERYEVIPERELNALKAKHAALVEAVKELLREAKAAPPLDNEWEHEDGTKDYSYLIWDSDIAEMEKALAAEQEDA